MNDEKGMTVNELIELLSQFKDMGKGEYEVREFNCWNAITNAFVSEDDESNGIHIVYIEQSNEDS